jgi:hypothetical protein
MRLIVQLYEKVPGEYVYYYANGVSTLPVSRFRLIETVLT